MRIHTDTLTNRDLIDASMIARVEFDRWLDKGSRERDHAFDVTLTGESRRAPNNRERGNGEKAATWDQWGVFLSVLFERDPEMVTPYYKDRSEFNYRTEGRFIRDSGSGYWPPDAHGDHTFRFSGTPGAQSCTKCSAVQRWM